MCTLQRKFYLAKMNPVVILLVEYLVMQIFTYPDKTASKLCIHFRKMHLKLYPFYSKFHFKAYSHYDYFKTNQGLAKCKKGHFSCCRSSLTFWCGLQQAGSSDLLLIFSNKQSTKCLNIYCNTNLNFFLNVLLLSS